MNRSLPGIARCVLPFLILLPAGCGSEPEKKSERSFPGVKITVAAVGDVASLEAVKAWRSTWERETGGSVTFVPEAVEPADLKGAHVVLYPADRLGDMVDNRALGVLLDDSVRPPIPLGSKTLPPDRLAYSDIAPAFREQVAKYGDERFGLPIGGSGLVLIYRRDAFESEANREAAKAKGITLEPPKTWEDLDALAAFFHGRDWDGDGTPESGIVAALGPDPEGVGDTIVLARAAALGQHPDYFGLLFDNDTMEPRIVSPPFVEALSAVSAWKKAAPPRVETFDAEAARAALRAGAAARLVDQGARAAHRTAPKRPSAVSVSALPGSPRVYDPGRKSWGPAVGLNRVMYLPRGGGWVAGVSGTATGPPRQAAIDFVRSIAGPETSRLLVADPARLMLPVRNAQLGGGLPDPRAAQGVDSSAWGIAVARTVTAPRIVPGLRIPGTDRYLSAFGKARVAAMNDTPAESALSDAAKAWAEITKSLGVERQLWHYQRSLNKIITERVPPPASKGSTP